MFSFILNSILLGVGLAMDAFSVSLANGLNEPQMGKKRMCLIAGTFAFFQFLMPVLGWGCVRYFVELFSQVQQFIPWIGMILLCFIGGKMILEAFRSGKADDEETAMAGVSLKGLMVQGIATSIDALSVGFTISEYGTFMAFSAALIIAAVTFVICMYGLVIGRQFGTRLADKASILGGCILILIGLEIAVRPLLGL
ncbi:MAG: manganese efflux pump [Clostridia bacterium]|nr:manganese efflux pump [Clostridia bacterium]